MDKVKLPREVANAINFIRESKMAEHALYDRSWLESVVDDTNILRKSKNVILKYISYYDDRFEVTNQLMNYYGALVNGYEVEESPEDKVRRYFNEQSNLFGSFEQDQTLFAIKYTLDLLGIKIKGVNSND